MNTLEIELRHLPPTSFSSLPYDVVLNCFARMSKINYPSLSLVSKEFRFLILSPDLKAQRSSIGNTEKMCVCLNLDRRPRWFVVSQIPKQKLKPLPCFPREYPQSATVVSSWSEIYIIEGFLRGKRSIGVFILNCGSHQWRRIPNMCLPRASPAAKVFQDGRILVIGGSRSKKPQDYGETFEPKTNSWISKTLDDTTVKQTLVLGGKLYSFKIDNTLYLRSISDGTLYWREPKNGSNWFLVKGIDRICFNRLLWVGLCGGGRVIVWWKTVMTTIKKIQKTQLWCAEISFETRASRIVRGFVQWFDH